jgi:hypothetical protein
MVEIKGSDLLKLRTVAGVQYEENASLRGRQTQCSVFPIFTKGLGDRSKIAFPVTRDSIMISESAPAIL